MDALADGWVGGRDVIMVLGMDALANGWVGSMDIIILLWAWMHWPMDGLVAGTLSWFWAWMHWPMDGLVAGTSVKKTSSYGGRQDQYHYWRNSQQQALANCAFSVYARPALTQLGALVYLVSCCAPLNP